ncbi:glycoside hydrolase family 3 N-terminal domain-containing protein [Lysobacter korlensis]|uniref:Glycoside hydrolase family 3 N-terminal domain-containing protein n=1 Tax=Lysobacter korlensis TaxID=553636 RepID=A0ABV6RV20_9GAMM
MNEADGPAVLLPGFAGAELPGWLEQRLADGLAGVCIFGSNITSRGQLRELTDRIRAANPAAIIAIDEEGGDVTRLFHDTGSPFPGNAVLGRIDDERLTERVARTVGEELRGVGVNLDFAPVADVNSNPMNPVIGVRSFGADAAATARHTAAWVRGLQSTGVAGSVKHFPGHGDTAQDSHLALPVVDLPLEALRRRELLPFRAAIDTGVRTVMTSHILLPQVDGSGPATFSERILTSLLREELAFDGVIVTDALDMAGASGTSGLAAAAARAISGGADLLCLGSETPEALLGEVESALAATRDRRLAEAAARVQALGTELAVAAAPSASGAASEAAFPLEPTIAAFDVRAGTVVPGGARIVVLETEANIAVGAAPWGPAAAGADVIALRAGDRLPSAGPLILVGRDNHRHEWARGVISTAREARPGSVAVDMGWPSEDRAFADVATFGASRHAGDALLRWLEERSS